MFLGVNFLDPSQNHFHPLQTARAEITLSLAQTNFKIIYACEHKLSFLYARYQRKNWIQKKTENARDTNVIIECRMKIIEYGRKLGMREMLKKKLNTRENGERAIRGML